MKARRASWRAFLCAALFCVTPPHAAAQLGGGLLGGGDSQTDPACGIWLCGPYGFPQGCEAMEQTFLSRVKFANSPAVPRYEGCSIPGGITGSYRLGKMSHEGCPDGYSLRPVSDDTDQDDGPKSAIKLSDVKDDDADDFVCVETKSCAPEDDVTACQTAKPILRTAPYYLEMRIGDTTYPRYYFKP